MNLTAEEWKFFHIKLLSVNRVPALCIKLQPSANWMLPGSTSLAALKRLTASSLVLLADYPQQRENQNAAGKKKNPSLSLTQTHGPVGNGFQIYFFLMSLRLIFSHNCIPFEGISKDFV